MHRNLDRRVEVMVQVKNARLAAQLDGIFDSALDPVTRCWTLEGDGTWTASPEPGTAARDHQVELMRSRAS